MPRRRKILSISERSTGENFSRIEKDEEGYRRQIDNYIQGLEKMNIIK